MVDLKLKLPDGFLEEEERCGYLVSRKMKEIWAVELDLFAEFDRVCRKYGITYFASSGTMLGAVRHHGFIPWDDDMDVMMMRDEYIRLCNVAEKEFKYPYFFQTEYTDRGSLRGHAQLRNSSTTAILSGERSQKYKFNQGIFFDIFPLDVVPADVKEREQFIAEVKRKREICWKIANITKRYQASKNPIKRPVKYLLYSVCSLFCDYINDYRDFENTCQRYNKTNSDLISWVSFLPDETKLRKRAYFQDSIELPFEFLKIPVCKNFDQALTDRFGDWHEFVKGASLHGSTLFDTEKSYKAYL